jgi:hypothetical protein
MIFAYGSYYYVQKASILTELVYVLAFPFCFAYSLTLSTKEANGELE